MAQQAVGGQSVPLRSQHWVVTLLLSVLSLGLYIPVWLKRLNAQLGEARVSPALIRAVLVVIACSVGLDVLNALLLHLEAPFLSVLAVSSVGWLVGIASMVLAIIAAFMARDVVMGVYDSSCNGVGTFLFNIFFLQIRVNTLNKRRGVRWRFTREDLRLLGIFLLVFAAYVAIVVTAPEPSIPESLAS